MNGGLNRGNCSPAGRGSPPQCIGELGAHTLNLVPYDGDTRESEDPIVPIGGFVSNAVEKETIITPRRAVMEIEEISLFYGDDPDNPAPFDVKDDDGKVLFTSDPYVNALVTIVDDYTDGSLDGKKFWDKLYLSHIKSEGVYAATPRGKLGRIFRTHPKYGDDCFTRPETVYDEQDLKGHRFEAKTEQRQDKNGAKLEGTRIAYETIDAIPDRSKKKASKKTETKDAELTEEERAEAQENLS